tara:strand:- start:490 stop:843 length:354 start_codon:yes stop_codon:yes gene_type:complete
MSKLSHNPQSYVNGYISMMRNMILLSSVGLVIVNSKYRIISLFVFLFSFTYGIKSAYDFNKYVEYLKTLELENPLKFQVNQWKQWVYMTYIYLIIILIIVFYFVIKQKNIRDFFMGK